MNKNEFFANLPETLKKKLKGCKSADELVTLLGEEGIKLADEQLEGLAGGVVKPPVECSNFSFGCQPLFTQQ